MANFIPSWKIVAISDLFASGHSVRLIAKKIGVSKGTVERYSKMFRPEMCMCGAPNNHKGWCAVRVALSPGRQRFLLSWRPIKKSTKKFWADYAAQINQRG